MSEVVERKTYFVAGIPKLAGEMLNWDWYNLPELSWVEPCYRFWHKVINRLGIQDYEVSTSDRGILLKIRPPRLGFKTIKKQMN